MMQCKLIPPDAAVPERPAAARALAALAFGLALGLGTGPLGATASAATVRTVCTITINSSDEREVLERQLPRDRYRFVELVDHKRRDWLPAACESAVRCDALVISGHFDDGTEFYSDRFGDREHLKMEELQRASCSASCRGLFEDLKEVYLFGCNTLQDVPRHVAGAEVRRSLERSGRSSAEAERIAAELSERYGQSNRDRLRQMFAGVPLLYGFSSAAPLGRYAGPMLERYFQSAPAGEVAAGRASAALLSLFGPTSMVAMPGLAPTEPQAALRADLCRLADEKGSPAERLAFVHEKLGRDVAEVRMFLDHLEDAVAAIDAAARREPAVVEAFAAIQRDAPARERFLAFARDADAASVEVRMLALARELGWLSAVEHDHEFVAMLARRLRQLDFGKHEVDLVCAARDAAAPPLAPALLATGITRERDVTHQAVLACLGEPGAHRPTVRALASPHEAEVEVAQVYLRHRPLGGAAELRSLTGAIAGMPGGEAQLRALRTLARQRIADPSSLEEIVRLFARLRSVEAQRAIAEILIRSDHRTVAAPAQLARTLRQHRVRSRDGPDVIDALLRLLDAA